MGEEATASVLDAPDKSDGAVSISLCLRFNCLIVPEDDRAAALDVCIVLKEPNKVHGDTVLEHAGAECSGL